MIEIKKNIIWKTIIVFFLLPGMAFFSVKFEGSAWRADWRLLGRWLRWVGVWEDQLDLNLNHLWMRFGRVALSLQLFFFLSDIVMDAWALRIKRFDDILCLMWDLDWLSREGRAGGDRDRVSLHALLASCEDVVCFVAFVQTSAWAFAAVQLVIFMASGFLQMRRTNCQSFRKIIAESFNVGLPCNTLQRMFLEEKTFEAPLSLFVQLLESGHLVSS